MYTAISIVLAIIICFALAIIIPVVYKIVSMRSTIEAGAARNSGNWDEAIAGYSESLTKHCTPKLRVAILINRANCYSAKGNFTASLFDYTESLEIERTVTALQSRGACYFSLGNLEPALKDINEAHLMDPTDAETLFYRSVIYRKMGNAVQADLDIKAAMVSAQTYQQKKANLLQRIEAEYRIAQQS